MEWTSIIGIFAAVASLVVAMISMGGAVRSGLLKRVRLGSFEIETSEREVQEAQALITSLAAPREQRQAIPFETEHLARYYAQVLLQSKVAFWFSLTFASVGFMVIVAAAFLYNQDTTAPTIVQGIAGVIVDSVAALFFVQSRRAQTSMTEFFDKLRKDRQQAESRALCDEVHNPDAKDALRIQLSLYYAGIDNHDVTAGNIFGHCLSGNYSNVVQPAQP